MAIPIIIGAVAAGAGIYKAAKAVSDNKDAQNINADAKVISAKAERKMNQSREACYSALERLGQKKTDAININIRNFLDVYTQIKDIAISEHEQLNDMHMQDFSGIVLQEMQKSVSFIAASGLGAAGGAVSGALTAFGAYSGTMAFAAASTGTAISSLSGAAATNATLAWLGGGSLASGGLGVAGGTLALGALAAGPALLVAGWYMGSKAETNLNRAKSNRAEAERFAADCDAAIALTNGIHDVAHLATKILSGLRKHSRRNLVLLKQIIDQEGFHYPEYSQSSKEIVLKNYYINYLVKILIDTPILDSKGNLLGDASSNLLNLRDCVRQDFSQESIESLRKQQLSHHA